MNRLVQFVLPFVLAATVRAQAPTDARRTILVLSIDDSVVGSLASQVQQQLLPTLTAAGVRVIPQSEVSGYLATHRRPHEMSEYRELGDALHATVTIALEMRRTEREAIVRGTIVLPQDTIPRPDIALSTSPYRVPHCVARAILSDTTIQRVLGVSSLETSDANQRSICRLRSDEDLALSPDAQEMFRQRGFALIGGVHLGTPAVLSGNAGIRYGLGQVADGSIFVSAEPGVLAFRYGGGYFLYANPISVGAILRVARLTGWRDALGVKRGVQYTGAEATLLVEFLSLRVGLYGGKTGAGSQTSLFTIDIGVGY